MRRRADRMTDELEAGAIDVAERTEGLVGHFVLRAGVHQRSLCSGKGQGIAVVLQQVLANFRADGLDQVAQVAEDRVVASHSLPGLQQVQRADGAQPCRDQGQPPDLFEPWKAEQGEQHAERVEGVTVHQRQIHRHPRVCGIARRVDGALMAKCRLLRFGRLALLDRAA